MCRNIKQLRQLESQPSPEEIQAAALQFVRKVTGYRKPSRANQAVFELAIKEISRSTQALLDGLSAK